MRPLLHPTLVNGRSGDPAVYIETLFEKRAILFDLGDIAPLSPRKVHRLDRVFVSHAHLDHFIGFDRLLRILIGREKTVALYGPSASSITCIISFRPTSGIWRTVMCLTSSSW
jgi:ribonuclease Z